MSKMKGNGSGKHRAIPEISIDARTLQKRLHDAHVNGDHGVITYKELSQLIGREVQAEARSVLMTARRREEAPIPRGGCEVVFGAVLRVGLRWLDDKGLVGTGRMALEHVHRTARRGARRLTFVTNFDGLPSDLKLQHNLHASVLAVLANRSGRRALKKLEAKIAPDGVLPLAKCLEAMKETL
jgi:hypothetical protein